MLRQDEQARVDGVRRFKELLAVAALPVLTGYAAIATILATVAALAAEPTFSVSGVLLAAGPGWLAAYQVPVVIGDNELGLLPLALTIGVCALVARSASGAVARLGYRTPRQAGVVIGTVAGTHACVGMVIAVLANGAIVTADPLVAFGSPGFVSGAAATVGVARRCGLLDFPRHYVDAAALAGLRAAALGMAGLFAASALVLTVTTALAVPTMQTLFVAHAPGFGSGFGMLLLCLGYLPNAVLAALAFLLGPGFTLGPTSIGPTHFEGGSVPGVPLLAGLPESYAAWWPALFLLPALIGVGVGWTLRESSPSPMERLRSVAVAGAVIGFGTVVLTTLAGGSLGGSAGGVPFPGLLLPAGLLSAAAFAWIFLPGAFVAWLTGPRAVSDVQDGESDGANVADDECDAGADAADASDTDVTATDDEPAGADGTDSEDENGAAAEVGQGAATDMEDTEDDDEVAADSDAGSDNDEAIPESDLDTADTQDGEPDGKADATAEPAPVDIAAESDATRPDER